MDFIRYLKNRLEKIKIIEVRHGLDVKTMLIKDSFTRHLHLLTNIIRWHIAHPDYISNRGLYFSNIELSVTTNCSLRCKNCAHYMYRYSPVSFAASEEINHDIKILLDSVRWIDEFRVLGGEPLLHPELHKIVAFLLESDKIGRVEIVTNGTIPLSKEIENLFPNDRLIISISNYGELSTRIKEYEANQNINLIVSSVDSVWRYHGDLTYTDRSVGELKHQYMSCYKDKCVMLNGRLYGCACCAYGSDLGAFALRDDEYADIHNTTGREELQKSLKALKCRDYYTACSYCYFGTKEFIPVTPAEQLVTPAEQPDRANQQ